ncbi:NAD(P)H-dependent oxidoreductase subunit E [Verrucomicrobiaceae bacterium N1E253]|uniref:NAD(P)H-dependent oxidoreductase subunit E n=1 Tax=Oceaniferula marina TaxID=2748318 RepID=A0A851GED7_9BACT|nr:NAD(P)H-dependent oxidoreductase subunit E [Oceaniferula marina]NWK54071.1 NAD(P)H-dependent oxidoreductase subunit E [Oceaniferula marina]
METTSTFPPFVITAEIDAEADKRIAQYPDDKKRSAVLPLLHIIQHQFGFINKEATEWIAGKLGLEPMQVFEVVSFYPGFRESAPGKYHFRICRTLSCAMAGSAELMERICELTGIDRSNSDSHHNPVAVSPCGQWSVEYAECLASCGTGPVCLVNDDFHEAVAPEKAEALLNQYKG